MMNYQRKNKRTKKSIVSEPAESHVEPQVESQVESQVEPSPASLPEPEQSFLTSSDDESDEEQVTVIDTKGDKRFLMLTKQLQSLQNEVTQLRARKERKRAPKPRRYYVKRDDEITRAMRHKIINL
jgi:hypothetical protein